ncbi:MAG: pyrimidine-nucleoside phosphorylase [Hydrogenibacillus schlegelii]|uniref:Pyrimidine-nucleoside phosphorylase n=1 Tax=Hydrogenibacillus schlegelii TaxID=1484 RepID=A0A947CZI9_HYDSH|nr:pyrimidine-nucleoside phosphorylase [Hydrogenibacillus schlegelii]
MHAVDVVRKKERGETLQVHEIRRMVEGLVDGTLPEAETRALIRAVSRRGLSEDETLALARAIAETGDTLDLSSDLSSVPGVKVGKITTGGVGDKTSLVALPAVAALGLPVAHVSARGLGPHAGSVDKLAAVPGFRSAIGREAFLQQVQDIGLAVMEKPASMAPAADRLLAVVYDAFLEEIGRTYGAEGTDGAGRKPDAGAEGSALLPPALGVAVFMGRLLAAGYEALLVDVKVGAGALFRSEEDARSFAELWVRLSRRLGKKGAAVIVNMNQPHGQEVGTANEVREAVEVLMGRGPDDVLGLSMRLGGEMLLLSDTAKTIEEAVNRVYEAIRSGAALLKFKEWVERQGADAAFIDEPALLPQPEYEAVIGAQAEGVLLPVDAGLVGAALLLAGGARRRLDAPLDPACGATLYYKESEKVSRGEALARLVAGRDIPDEAAEMLASAFRMTDQNIMYSHTVIDVVK